MVDQSELPFRMLARAFGADLCYTPMIHARLFSERDEEQRKRMWETCEEDRPLVVQFCGHDPQALLAAAQAVQDKCDAVDLNLGCPQAIARKGRYGAYLLEEQELVLEIVRTMSAGLRIPVTVKIRLLGDREATIDYAKRIVAAGASALTVHGRTKEMKGQAVGSPDWPMVRRVRAALGVPVIANGGVGSREAVGACLEATGADAVMTSELSLAWPGVFQPVGAPRVPVDDVVAKYLGFVEATKHLVYTPHKPCRAHLFKLLFAGLTLHPDLRERLGSASEVAEMAAVAAELAGRGWEAEVAARHPDGWLLGGWYWRHREGRLTLDPDSGGDGGCGGGSGVGKDSGVGGTGVRGEADEGGGGGRRGIEFHLEALRSCETELCASSAEYQAALEGASGANKKQRNALKRRVVKAENRKAKLLRKISRLKAGEDDGGDEHGGGEEGSEKGAGGSTLEVKGEDDTGGTQKKQKTDD